LTYKTTGKKMTTNTKTLGYQDSEEYLHYEDVGYIDLESATRQAEFEIDDNDPLSL